MPWDRRLDLFVNVGAPPEFVLLAGKASREPAQWPVIVSGDKHVVRVWLLDATVGGGPPAILTLAAGEVMILAGKARAAATELLFSATGFAPIDTGAGTCYEAALDLTSNALKEAFGDDAAIAVLVDVEVENAANTLRRTRQFQAVVRRGVYTNEAEPTPAAPAYPAPEALQLRVPTGGLVRFKDGDTLQLKNKTTGKFHTLFVDGADGAEVLGIGPGED